MLPPLFSMVKVTVKSALHSILKRRLGCLGVGVIVTVGAVVAVMVAVAVGGNGVSVAVGIGVSVVPTSRCRCHGTTNNKRPSFVFGIIRALAPRNNSS